MQTIPISAVPVQNIPVVIGGQNCQIYLYQNYRGLFFDLNSNGVDIVNGIICQNANPLVCIRYLGFQGNFFFIDTQGTDDPPPAVAGDADSASGLGSRWQLVYITEAENTLAAQTNVYFS